MTLQQFIQQHRTEIDAVIKSHVDEPRLNGRERRLWVENEYSLYLWAKDEGVKI